MVNEAGQKRAWKIWELSQTEAEYKKMLIEVRELEKEYEAAIGCLTEEQEKAVRDFVTQCEAMSWRMVQIACSIM